MMLIPGPVEVPEVVLKASAYVQNHRSAEFKDIVKRAQEHLNRLTDSKYSLMTTGSGTSAVETLAYSMVAPGEKVLAVSFGEFGNRMTESLRRRGASPVPLVKNYTESLEKGEISDVVAGNRDIKSIFLVQNETGNGTCVSNLREIAEEANGLGLKVLVDSVSGVGGMEIRAEKWGIHALAGCSQKGLASVPGIGFVSVSEEGERFIRDDKDMPAYLDMKNSIKFMNKSETPYTPSTGSFRALLAALLVLEKETPEKRWKRHQATASFVRKKLTESGYELYGTDRNYSNTVVAFKPGVPAPELVSKLSAKDIVVSKGMGDFAEKMVRLGLVGMVDGTKIEKFLNTLWEVTGSDSHVDSKDLPAEAFIDPEVYNIGFP